MIGALGAVSIAAYLLPSFADGPLGRGGHLPEVADPSGGALPDTYSPLAERWQNLPLLALHSSMEVAAGDEVRILTLQAAFERERSSAAAGQLQIAALQEQLANLLEKQEEILILREQLADAEAHERREAGPAIAETERPKSAEDALLKVAALQKELASLSTQVLKAKTMAESERMRAASALAQLESVQQQLAVATALHSDRPEAVSQLRPDDEGTVDEASLNDSGDDSTERASNLSLPALANTVPLIEKRQAQHRRVRPDKRENAIADKPRQATSSGEIKPLAKPGNKSGAAPVRAPEPGVSRLARPRHEPRNQSVRSVGKPAQRVSQPRHMLAQDTQNRGAISLPNDLLPDSRLW
ncbi:hypothetical protein [Microvirga arabica]|uniref:Uncharacterized protein n=1 Tax=Microvirga arabica TaxID=1128671 RepID=A0ABV6YG75_9HYPH|nr:hypothetical protein [Microvirga arabica]MBM1169411.1 hypothetical protein [Microvirga arabica]